MTEPTTPRAEIPAVRNADRAAPAESFVFPVALVLDNLRSAFNVGNIFRLAEATRAETIFCCGYTAAPPHAKLAKTARGCEQLVACRQVPTALGAVRDLRDRGYRIYGVETVAGAGSIWDVRFTFPAALVFGNEALGVAAETLGLCDEFVELPCYGVKNSVNVANSAAVTLYAALRQWQAGAQ